MNNRVVVLLITIIVIVLFLVNCMQMQPSPDPRGTWYAGSDKCIHCHQSISSSYAHTAHFLSSRVADSSSVIGSFSKDSNRLIVNDTTEIMMEKRDSGFYQVLKINDRPKMQRRFDLVMGSSMVQTFFYWQKDGFFQLPVFYFIGAKTWSSSPGSYSSKINFSRPAINGCFECHTSFARGDPNGISVAVAKRNNWVFNIDCERCHGPSARHVQFQEENPDAKYSKFMVSFKSLSVQRKIEACAVCHSGTSSISLKSPYGFKIGDTLSFFINILPSNPAVIDLHGNLTRSLSASKCYQNSSIDCTTCHNPHARENTLLNKINNQCQTCHIADKNFCRLAKDSNIAILRNNCVNCHMPRQAAPSLLIQAANSGSATALQIVNHRIGIYPEQTEKILNLTRVLREVKQ